MAHGTRIAMQSALRGRAFTSEPLLLGRRRPPTTSSRSSGPPNVAQPCALRHCLCLVVPRIRRLLVSLLEHVDLRADAARARARAARTALYAATSVGPARPYETSRGVGTAREACGTSVPCGTADGGTCETARPPTAAVGGSPANRVLMRRNVSVETAWKAPRSAMTRLELTAQHLRIQRWLRMLRQLRVPRRPLAGLQHRLLAASASARHSRPGLIPGSERWKDSCGPATPLTVRLADGKPSHHFRFALAFRQPRSRLGWPMACGQPFRDSSSRWHCPCNWLG
jgi:hypothetical protein